MFIKLYGTRGSIPVSNKQILKYGGNTTCVYIEASSGESVIIDAGTGIRALGSLLIKNKRNKLNLIFTHYHWDHIQGLPFFAPIYLKNSVINIYGPKNEVTVKKALSYQMTKPFFPTVTLDSLASKITFKDLKNSLRIGSLKINTIINNHPNYTVGLKFTEKNNSVAFLTDNELFAENGRTLYKNFVKFIKDAIFLIHDAQYTDEIYKRGWGHSTYKQVMMLAKDAGVKNVMFTHHDPHSGSDKFIDNALKSMRKKFPEFNIKAAAEGNTIILR